MFLLGVSRKIISVTLAACLLAGCGPEELYTRDYLKQNGVVFCTNSNVSNLDPTANEINVTSVTIAQNVFNRLIRFDPESGRFLPEIARSWTVSEDRTVYRFHLDPEISFHATDWFKPSRTLSADDVIFSFGRIMDYTNPFEENSTQFGHASQNTFDILDFRHLVQMRQIVGKIRKIDRNTVEFALVRPTPHFLELLANTNCVIFSREFFESLATGSKREEYFRNHPVGTGPFQLFDYRYNDHIILRRNPAYWDREHPPKLDRLVLDITPNRARRMNKMISSECQVTNQPSKAVSVRDNATHNFGILGSDTFDSTVIYFNTSRGPTENPEVRRLIAEAVNHEVYGNVLYPHSAMTPTSMLPFDVTFYATVAHRDIASILRNMSETVKRRLGRSNIVYVYIERSNSKMGYNISRITQLLRSDLSSLGISARVREVDSRSLARLVARGSYDIVVTRNVYPMKMPLYKLFVTFSCSGGKPASSNYSAYCSRELQELLEQYRFADIRDIDIQVLEKINSVLEKDIPMLPVSFASDYYIYNQDVKGIRRALNNGLDFSEAYLR